MSHEINNPGGGAGVVVTGLVTNAGVSVDEGNTLGLGGISRGLCAAIHFEIQRTWLVPFGWLARRPHEVCYAVPLLRRVWKPACFLAAAPHSVTKATMA